MLWSEASVLDAVEAYFDRLGPCRMLRQVEVEDRRIDAIVVSDRGTRVAVEAKVSRADFRRETDEKRGPAWRATHRCWYAAPAGIIAPETVPDGWGLLAVHEDGVQPQVRPRQHESTPQVDRLVSTLLWRAAASESRERTPGDPVLLGQEVERLQGLLATRDAAVRREMARAQDAAEQVAALVGDQVCSCCRMAIVYTRVGSWRHVDRTWDGLCETERAERERRRRKALTGAEYTGVKAPRITPASVPEDH